MHTRLYLITPPKFELEVFAKTLDAALGAGDVACLQLRLKDVDDDTIRRAAKRLMPIAHAHGVSFILNDRPDLAAELGADGVHIGQEDMTYAKARALMGPKKIVGVTCHSSRHLAIEAAEQGADYVAFGAFYPTTTKDAKTRAEPELMAWWTDLFETQAVAIGGITITNAQPLVDAHADFLAVSSGVWDHPQGAQEAVKAFNEIFDRSKWHASS